MILYFSGSGNSQYVAKALGSRLDDKVVSLNDLLKYQKEEKFVSEKPYVIVAPIYAWRLPIIIEELLLRATFLGTKKMYFVPTMGSQTGNCDKYCRKICHKIGLEYMGLKGIAMPDNYVSYSVMLDHQAVNQMLKEAIPKIDDLAKHIQAEKNIIKDDKTAFASVLSGPVNVLFNKFMTTSKNYVVSERCISCGLCERVCAVNNIEIKDGKPVFFDRCINCYACIHHCPKAAIDIKGKTEKHGRYVCPEYEE